MTVKPLRTCLPIAVLVVGALWPSAANATWPGKPGLVAYWGLKGIQTVRADGTHHRVVLKSLLGTGFAWSPNGHEIAYACGLGVCRMRADGSQQQVIVNEGYSEP